MFCLDVDGNDCDDPNPSHDHFSCGQCFPQLECTQCDFSGDRNMMAVHTSITGHLSERVVECVDCHVLMAVVPGSVTTHHCGRGIFYSLVDKMLFVRWIKRDKWWG